MSLPQFGYSYPTTGTTLPSSQLLMSSPSPVTTPSGGSGTAGGGTPGSGSGASAGAGGAGGCCEGGRILGTNPHTGQPVCSCQYSPGLLTYSRVAAGLSDSVYPTSPYGTPGYVPFGTDPSAFYPPLTSAYDLKEAGDTWRGISQPAACYPYDPTGMSTYPYTNAYGAMDINSAARRKNATRENTNTLKAWLYEHRKNPYPTKGEKIMLAIITKMTLTQVSTWFANARRRLKKENKMTWSPRNRSGDADADGDGDDDDDDEGKSKDDEDEDGEKGGEKKEKEKDDAGSCKEDKDCVLVPGQTNDSGVHAKRLFDDDDPSPITSHGLAPLPHSHSHAGLQPPPPGLQQPPQHRNHHHQQQQQPQQQQHSPHDSANFLGLTSPSSSQPFPGLTSPEAVGLNSPVMDNKRPDSLCSNSNDSGLSDVNCNFSAEAQAAAAVAGLDASGGFRPKIWSLAHVATSDNSPSPYLTSVSAAAAGSASGARTASTMAPRSQGGMESSAGGKQPLSSSSIPSGMQPWGGASSLYGGAPSPRSSSFGMSMGMGMGMNVNMNMNNHHHKGSLAPPMFSHPLTGMASGLGPSSGGYTQLSPFYPQSKLSVD